MALTLILSMSTWFSASAVIPQLRRAWNLSQAAESWLTIAVQIGFVCGSVASSMLNLSDVLAPRHVILGGSVGAAAANVLLEAGRGASLAIPLCWATGFFLAGVYPPAIKLMSTWFRKRRGLALGVLVGALVVGNGMPHLVRALGGLNWRTVIRATSALTLAGGLITELAIREGPFPFPSAAFDPRQAGRAFANPGVRLATLGYVGHMWELYAMYTWFSAFLGDALITAGAESAALVPWATFAIFIAGALGCWAGGLLADRWGRARTTMVMMGISGSCALGIGLAFGSSVSLVMLVALIWGFAVVADSAQFSTIVTELADQSYVGTALTLQLAAGFTVSVTTIWLMPLLRDAVGWRWAFAFLAPGPILGMLAMARLRSSHTV